MFTIPEQFSASAQSGLNAQLNLLNVFGSQAFDNVEKLVNLNLNAFKASVEESAAAAQQLLSAKNVEEFVSLAKAQTQPNLQNAVAYGSEFVSIAANAQADFTNAAEAQFAEANRKVVSLIDDAAKNAPAGTESAIAFFKTSLGNVTAGYEQFSKSTKQVTDAVEANFAAGVKPFAAAAEKPAGRSRK